MRKIIYDVGANNGDDIPYYLLKSDFVVAIEANPVLCELMEHRFQEAIRQQRLVIENCVATDTRGGGEVDFYLHKSKHVLSQLSKPANNPEDYCRQRLTARSIADIVEEHGAPHYIKIDIEGFDAALLRSLFAAGIRPPFLSAESHTLEVFQVFLEHGGYQAFKLVDGDSVSRVYQDRLIPCEATHEPVRYSFPPHSAGPFGNDIDGNWLTPENLMRLLAFAGLGWKDIHATNVEAADPSAQPHIREHLDRLIRFQDLMNYTGKRIVRSIGRRLRRLPTRIHRCF